MKIGLFFGSFNPIHIGHLIIANYITQNYNINELWFMVSPQNPFKPSSSLLNENHRLQLINLAIEGEKKLRGSNIEFKLPKPSYTIDTLTYLKKNIRNTSFLLSWAAIVFKIYINGKTTMPYSPIIRFVFITVPAFR